MIEEWAVLALATWTSFSTPSPAHPTGHQHKAKLLTRSLPPRSAFYSIEDGQVLGYACAGDIGGVFYSQVYHSFISS